MITIRRKRGDTLRLRFQTEIDLSVMSISAGARDSAGAQHPLETAIFDREAGLFEVWAGEPLAVGRYVADVKYTRPDHAQRTDSFIIQITEAMTP